MQAQPPDNPRKTAIGKVTIGIETDVHAEAGEGEMSEKLHEEAVRRFRQSDLLSVEYWDVDHDI